MQIAYGDLISCAIEVSEDADTYTFDGQSGDAVDLHQTACRGRGRSQEERMVATRSGSQDRPRSKAAESVGLEPLRVSRDPRGPNC